jgi:hypothetical protein
MFDNATGQYAGAATAQDFNDTKQARTDKSKIDSINNGTYPLSPEEKAMVDGLRDTWQKAIDQQKTDNANLQGGMATYLNLHGGGGQITSTIAISNIISKGADKINSMNVQMAADVAKMTRALESEDYLSLSKSYDSYNALQKERNGVITKMHDDTQAVYKDRQTKIETAQNMADNDIRTAILEAKRGGATPEQIAEMDKALAKHDMSAAVNAAGDSLLTATGIIGEYNLYKKQAIEAQVPYINFDDFKTKDDNRKIKIAAAGAANGVQNNQITDNERSLMTSFIYNPIVKDYNDIVAQKNYIQKIINGGSGGAADLALVFSFMKGLDPKSVVKETEYDNAAKSGNIFAGSFAKFNGYLKEEGGRLPESLKKEFKRLVDDKLSAQTVSYDNFAKGIKQIAKNQGLNPDNVVPNFSGADVGSTGDELIATQQQAEAKVIEFAKSHPALSPQMIQMEKDGTSMQDIFNWVNQQTK